MKSSLTTTSHFGQKFKESFYTIIIARCWIKDLSMVFSICSIWFTTCYLMNEILFFVCKIWNILSGAIKKIHDKIVQNGKRYFPWKKKYFNKYRRASDARLLMFHVDESIGNVCHQPHDISGKFSRKIKAACHENYMVMSMWSGLFYRKKKLKLKHGRYYRLKEHFFAVLFPPKSELIEHERMLGL